MDAWTAFAMGPGFRIALAVCVIGLGWHLIGTSLACRRALRRAGDRDLPHAALRWATLKSLLPGRRFGDRPLYGITTLLFHICIIAVPLFLGGHVALWAGGLGFSWPVLPETIADVLSYVALLAVLVLLLHRVFLPDTRALSRPSDYLVLVLIALPFLAGVFVRQPGLSPLPFDTALLIHVTGADLLLLLLPFTRIVHCVLLPLAQYASQLGWHLVPGAGARVREALRDESASTHEVTV